MLKTEPKSVEYSIFRHFHVIFKTDLLKCYRNLVKINQNRIKIQFSDIFKSFPCHFTDWLHKNYHKLVKIGSKFNFQTFPCHFTDWFTEKLQKNWSKLTKIGWLFNFQTFYVIFLTNLMKYYQKLDQINPNRLKIQFSNNLQEFSDIFLPFSVWNPKKQLKIDQNQSKIGSKFNFQTFPCHLTDWFTEKLTKIGWLFHFQTFLRHFSDRLNEILSKIWSIQTFFWLVYQKQRKSVGNWMFWKYKTSLYRLRRCPTNLNISCHLQDIFQSVFWHRQQTHQ